MGFSYKPLWKLLIDKDMTKKNLMEQVGISKSTIDKMGKCENISLNIIEKICRHFNCKVEDILEFKE